MELDEPLNFFQARVPLTEPAPAPAKNAQNQAPRPHRDIPVIRKAESNVADLFNDIGRSLLKGEAMLRPPFEEPMEVEVQPARKPGQSMYAGSLG